MISATPCWLLIKQKDDARSDKVLSKFRTSCKNAAQLLWELDDDDVPELTLHRMMTSRTPVVVAFNNGEQIMDFVAQSPAPSTTDYKIVRR